MEVIDDLNEAVDFIVPSAVCGNIGLDDWIHGLGFLVASIPAALLEDHEHLLIESGRGQASGSLLEFGKGREDLIRSEGLKERR